MSSGRQTTIHPSTFRTYQGPSLEAPFAAVVGEINSPHIGTHPGALFKRLLGELFRLRVPAPIAFANEDVDFPTLVVTLALAWQETGQPLGLRSSLEQLESNLWRVAVEYISAGKALRAVQAANEVADVLFRRATGDTVDSASLPPLLREVRTLADEWQLGTVSHAYLSAAKKCKIPFYELVPGSRFLMYGQGSRALLFFEATNSKDAVTGDRLARDKSASNRLVKRLGFPGVEHVLVKTLPAARQAAQNIGYPLVVKPLDRNGSIGVTVGIENSAELDAAVATALPLSTNGWVLVERYVAGDEYRLSVFNGKLLRASRLVPAHIVGDGKRTIAKIVDAENAHRRTIRNTEDAYIQQLPFGEKAQTLIRKQGFSLDDTPPAGQRVHLAGTSNLKSGGRREEVTSIIHPDNAAMAEAIARSFHLSAAGIDFITPDIGKSWTEAPCAIIEVNANPGTDEKMAIAIMRQRFPKGGRIPSTLIVEDNVDLGKAIAGRIQASGKTVGQTTNKETFLAGERRFAAGSELPERILGLLSDAACDALVVSLTPDDIVQHGVPHTYFDIAIIASETGLSKGMRTLITSNAAKCLEQLSSTSAEEIAEELVGNGRVGV